MLNEMQIFNTKKEIVKDLISQLSKEEVYEVIGKANNSIYWIIGHLTGARLSMLKLLGIKYDPGIDLHYFKKGSPHTTKGPEFTLLMSQFEKAGEQLYSALEKADPEWLKKPMKYIVNENMVTVADNIQFLIFHEDYHIGQIALIIRMMGKKGIGE
ncbi:MAG: DinB family protein [Calditrichaceae bacterium]|nr:DinB family protein [Calditrichaceae bacterium]MBN2708193.1 DinB family protein [Calditrichaceae bacterium]RQV97385.1 MAG: DUF1572 domain-containing protein [Calditrichota bacterium]